MARSPAVRQRAAGLVVLTDRELFGATRIRRLARPSGSSPGTWSASWSRRPGGPRRPRHRPLRRHDPARVRRRRQGVPAARLRRRGQDLPAGGPDRPHQRATPVAPGRASASWAAPTGSAPSGASAGQWPSWRRTCSRSTPRASRRRASASRRTPSGSSGAGGGVPVHRDARPAAHHRGGEGRHAPPAPMDRLVCGDVGYGKTEVALRAAFKAVQDGGRWRCCWSRPRSWRSSTWAPSSGGSALPGGGGHAQPLRAEAAAGEDRGGVADGTVDVLIGTHRILSKDIAFADLGLLVVDEEQRFGVGTRSASSPCARRWTC